MRSTSNKKDIIIVGAGVFGRMVATTLSEKKRVVLIDTNEKNIREAKKLGLEAYHGDAIDEDVLFQAGIEDMGKVIAITPNSEVNALVLQRAHDEYYVPELLASLDETSDSGLKRIIKNINAQVFSSLHECVLYAEKKYNSHTDIEVKEFIVDQNTDASELFSDKKIVPIFLKRGDELNLIKENDELKVDDTVVAFAM